MHECNKPIEKPTSFNVWGSLLFFPGTLPLETMLSMKAAYVNNYAAIVVGASYHLSAARVE
jgi:hypothetical protein